MHNPRPMRTDDDNSKHSPLGDGRPRTLSPNENPKAPRPVLPGRKGSNDLESMETPGLFGFKDDELHARDHHHHLA